MDIRQWSREFTIGFIEEYRRHPCLWKIKSANYTNAEKRGAAYEHLIAKLREVDPTATRETVVRKIDSLRSSYRKELKKLRNYNGSDKVHRPKLWYFDRLQFLVHHKNPNDIVPYIAEDDSCSDSTKNPRLELDIRQWPFDFTVAFIEEYRKHTCLWSVKSPEYSDRRERGIAYEHMLTKLREIIPNATKETVLRKIDSIRSSFRKELKKIEKSKRMATGADDVHKPKLRYFDNLQFLLDQDIARDEEPNIGEDEAYDLHDEDSTRNTDVDNECTGIDCIIEMHVPQSPESDEPASKESTSTESTFERCRKRGKKKRISCDDVLEKVINELQQKREDEFDVIGQNVANKLRKLAREEKIITEKLINDILFEAEMGKLDENTKMLLYSQK